MLLSDRDAGHHYQIETPGAREAGGTEGLMIGVPGVSEAWRDQYRGTLDEVMSDVS